MQFILSWTKNVKLQASSMALLYFTSPKSQVWSRRQHFSSERRKMHSPHTALSEHLLEQRPFLVWDCPDVFLSKTGVSTEQKWLLRRPCLKSYLFLGHRTPCRGFKTRCYSQTPVQLEVGAQSVFLNAQLEELTPGLSTWLRSRDLTHNHRGMGFIPLLTTKEFELILPKSL